MRSVFVSAYGSGSGSGGQQLSVLREGGGGVSGPAVVSITSSSYDKRGLLSRDAETLGNSLRSLAYLTLANTHVVTLLMLQDGGVSLLVQLLNDLMNSEDLLEASSSSSSSSSSNSSQDTESTSNSTNTTNTTSKNNSSSFNFDRHERLALISHALSAATNLVLRGRSKVRDALVEAGLVNVLVHFLDPLVAAIETLQDISAKHAENIASASVPTTSANSSNAMNEATAVDMDVDSLQQQPQQLQQEQPPSVAAPQDFNLLSHVNSSTEPNSPAPIIPQQQQQELSVNVRPSLDQTATSQQIPSISVETVEEQQIQPENIVPPIPTTTMAPQRNEMPVLPGIRLPLPELHETNSLLAKIITHQHHITMSIKILHMISKYPHLRHYMHVDSTRPVRPPIRDLCGAAIAAAEAERAAIPPQLPPTVHEISGLGIITDLLPVTAIPTPTPTILDLDQRRRANFDRFDSAIHLATSPASVSSIAASVMANQIRIRLPTPPPQSSAVAAASAIHNNDLQEPVPTFVALAELNPVTTHIPLIAYANEDPMELCLLESLTHLPTYVPAPTPPQSSSAISATTSHPKPHAIQSHIHYLPAPTNARSAFDLLEPFTSPCSLLPETRALSVAALRNAYRRDPLPTPAEGPPFAPLNQAMGPVLYMDADAYCGGASSSGGDAAASGSDRVIQRVQGKTARSVVVGLGHLRRCASSACGVWEKGYKVFSKCSRCRRVSYCSKNCQRRAWVLHKNWCLKYVGETSGVTAAAVSAPAAGLAETGEGGVGDGVESVGPAGAALGDGVLQARRGSAAFAPEAGAATTVVNGETLGGVAPSAEEMY